MRANIDFSPCATFEGPSAPILRMGPVEIPDTRFAKTDDGVFIAYQVVGDGECPPCIRLVSVNQDGVPSHRGFFRGG